MGLWQSTVVYLKSFYQPTTNLQLTEAKITITANKLAHSIRLRSMKVQQETKKIQTDLLEKFQQPRLMRSAQGEQAMMAMVVRNSEQLAGFEELVMCCQVIKKEAKQMEKDIGEVSQRCKLAISTILYAYEALQLKQWISLNDIIPQPHPKIDKKHISQPLREYIQFQQASFFSINTYILELCARNSLSLDIINEAGHNFSYNPSKLLQRESKSSMMFAVELEEYPEIPSPYIMEQSPYQLQQPHY